MESTSDGTIRRTPSRTSTTSSRSHKSETFRIKPRKSSSAISTQENRSTTETTDKSLTSFPSLSPESSPRLAEAKSNTGPTHSGSLQTPQQNRKHKPSIVDSLVANSPSFRGRSALFEDSPSSSTQHVPGALNHTSDENIRRLAAKVGVVVLIRQLADDIAQRDAEISSLRRRAEARERELKKMLREVEVSNLDIETRLHHIDNPVASTGSPGEEDDGMRNHSSIGKSVSSFSNGIGKLVGEAMEEAVGIDAEIDEGYLDNLDEQDKRATIRATGPRKEIDARSISSSFDSHSRSTTTVKGWKDYLWSNGGTSRKTSRANSVFSDQDGDAEDTYRARASSGVAARRKGLSDELFKPPQQRDNRLRGDSSQRKVEEDGSKVSRSRGSSQSVASWTLKLFAGNQHSTRDADSQGTIRGRSTTDNDGSSKSLRQLSKASTQTTSSARAALMRVSSRTSTAQLPKKAVQPLTLSSNGTVKGLSSQSVSSLPLSSPVSVDTGGNNLGPVEMDTILPHGSRPPTLTPSLHNIDDSADYLTDRFGFIYDQRRRKREAETFANLPKPRSRSNVEMLSNTRDMIDNVRSLENNNTQREERPDTPASIDSQPLSKPVKKWQDYLKVATFPTELLAHTPSSGAIMTLGNADIKKSLKRLPTFSGTQEGLPSLSPNPKPSTSSITAENAELATPFESASASPTVIAKPDTEPVKLLLAQLTELHDSLQREKNVKWNEFIRKIHAERGKQRELALNIDARSQQANMPEVSLTDGEMIGIATLGSKGKVGRAKYREFRSLVLAGIPVAHRAKVWAECSGASALRVPGYYEDLVSNGIDDPVILAQIQMDINRTLTDNVFFRNGPGVAKLNEVLLAYSRRNPEVGYCQGMNLITASLLLIMPTAEDAFWILVSMIENILPRHYYDNSLLTSRADQQVLRQYVTELLPRLSGHLDSLGIELEALTFQWFLSLFTDCLSAEALYRVWDILLCCKDEDGNGGSTFLFQVALALLKLNEGQLIACETPGEVYAYLGGEITNHAISIDGLIRASEGLKGLVRRNEVEDRRARWVEFERETVRERERIRQEGIIKRSRKGSQSTGIEAGEDNEDAERQLEIQSPMPVED